MLEGVSVRRRRLWSASSAVVCVRLLVWVSAALADDPVRIVVLKEHGIGSPALAQPYLDKFVGLAAKENGWDDAKGQYFSNRKAAEEYIDAQRPHYGILSLAAFLALKTKYNYDVIGRVAVTLVGGRQYAVISKHEAALAGCRGKTLASDHTDDVRFIERVVAQGAFKLTDFNLVPTQRPLQTIKKLLDDEAVCALIDDAQLAELSHLEGTDGIRSVWKSNELPPMAVVAFPSASAAERKRFQEKLHEICADDGEGACAEVGIVSLEATSSADYARVMAAYDE
jgi:hypothetical protein